MRKQAGPGRPKKEDPAIPAWADADATAPFRLTAHRHAFGTMLAWRGRARPSVVGFDLYAWTLTPDGCKPLRLNLDTLPLCGHWNVPDPDAVWLDAGDAFDAFLKKPSVAPPERVPLWHLQAWVEL